DSRRPHSQGLERSQRPLRCNVCRRQPAPEGRGVERRTDRGVVVEIGLLRLRGGKFTWTHREAPTGSGALRKPPWQRSRYLIGCAFTVRRTLNHRRPGRLRPPGRAPEVGEHLARLGRKITSADKFPVYLFCEPVCLGF